MLRRLELRNFRKHTSLDLDLQNGIIALRGSNEAGKSSLIEAIAYALFGIKACRESLENVVTWGQPPSSLSVGLELEVDGVTYAITRSKAGAELSYGDSGAVTGQSEVTAFMERIFGASAATASALWFVNQNAIRGALQGGAKATSALIEQLADFELVERIVNLVQENLEVGNTKPYEERLKQAEEFRASATEVPEPSAELRAQIDKGIAERVQLQAASDAAAAKSKAYDERTLRPLLDKRKAFDSLTEQHQKAASALEERRGELGALLIPKYDQAAHAAALAGRKAQEEVVNRATAWRAAKAAVDKLPSTDGVVWDGDAASYAAFKEAATSNSAQLSKRAAQLQSDLKLAERDQVHSKICGMCGKDVSELPEAAAKNAEAGKRIAALSAELAKVSAALDVEQQSLAACLLIDKAAAAHQRVIDQHGALIEATDTQVPPALRVVGDDPGQAPLVDYLALIRGFDTAKMAQVAAQAKQALLQEQVAKLADDLQSLEVRLAEVEFSQPELDAALEQAVQLTTVKVDLDAAWRAKFDEVNHLEVEWAKQRDRWLAYQENREAAEKLVADAKTALERVNFNNTLLKKVRAARPVVVDRLWNVVLAAVSYYFGQIRGTQSTVTRADGGFLVDGRSIDGLSGSTLDSLGLSIRLALLKTFLPRCNFLILDEPAAACDDAREAAMLGTVASSHFDQCLLVTHSDVADAYANQLVVL